MDDIDSTEYEWIEACNNSGLNYCASGKYDCHGYDYSSQYPSILASEQFEIPTKKAFRRQLKIYQLNQKLDFTKLK